MNHDERIEAVLMYWFGRLVNGMPLAEDLPLLYRRWFGGGSETDREIRQRFGDAVVLALAGRLDDWRRDSRGGLALVLLLDQFPRNMYRGREQAFAGDARAQSVVHEWLEKGWDEDLAAVERCFFYLPLEHSETLADQELCVARFEALLDCYGRDPTRTDAGLKQIRTSLDYALGHREIIRRFGRYPYRNAVLGRASTPEEERWLAEGGPRFGQ